MATEAKGRRSRDGRGSQARTRLARAAVTEAARVLFLERGYAATTIEAISDRSDVPPATVYRLFSSKLGILKALLDLSIAGDDQAVGLPDRPHVRALLADGDPRNQLSELPASSAASCPGPSLFTGSSSARQAPILMLLRCSPS